jgi:hypothetical protein
MFSCLLLKLRFIWSLLVNLISHSGHVDISNNTSFLFDGLDKNDWRL